MLASCSHPKNVDLQRNISLLKCLTQSGHLPVIYRFHPLVIHQIWMCQILIASGIHAFDHTIHIRADAALILRRSSHIRSVFLTVQEMLSHDQIINTECIYHIHLFLIEFRNVFCFKAHIDADIISIFIREFPNCAHIVRSLLHRHTDMRNVSVAKRTRDMIGEPELFDSHCDRSLNVLPLGTGCMLTPDGVCVIICCNKITHELLCTF